MPKPKCFRGVQPVETGKSDKKFVVEICKKNFWKRSNTFFFSGHNSKTNTLKKLRVRGRSCTDVSALSKLFSAMTIFSITLSCMSVKVWCSRRKKWISRLDLDNIFLSLFFRPRFVTRFNAISPMDEYGGIMDDNTTYTHVHRNALGYIIIYIQSPKLKSKLHTHIYIYCIIIII